MKPLSYDFEKSLGAAVISTARRLELAMTAGLRRHGITYAQWATLALLVRRGPVHQGEIAKQLGTKASTVCRLLDGMESNGWIAREPCPADPRRKIIVLRPKVQPVWEELKRIAHRVRRHALRGISKDRQRDLLATLGTVRSNLAADSTGARKASAR